MEMNNVPSLEKNNNNNNHVIITTQPHPDDHPLIINNDGATPYQSPPPSNPSLPPYPAVPQPMYTTLPNGQVQVVYNMPQGFVPPPPAYYPQSQLPVYAPPPQYASPPYASPSSPTYQKKPGDADGLYTAALITYVLGLFTFFPALASLVITFNMLKKGYICSSKTTVVRGLAITETIFWTLALGLGWLVVRDYRCDYYDYPVCYTWWGWTFLVFYWIIEISCGIPRIVYLRRRPN